MYFLLLDLETDRLNQQAYDYIIIGGGLAGLQLSMALGEDSFFDTLRIAIIEPEEKIMHDRSWSFWEEENNNKWDEVVHHQWKTAIIKDGNDVFRLPMSPYTYKSIRSGDFYAFAKDKISNYPNISWIKDKVLEVNDGHCQGENDTYKAEYIFDGRLSPTFKENGIYIQQHFKGWVIESDELQLDTQSFTMMDFSLKYKDHCCFTYVLPYSETKALVEFTFFSPDLVEDHVYDKLLQQYISKELNLTEYTILEIEQGNIPMSSFPFENENTDRYTKIGTAGGWVKASSGYSFKNTEQKIKQLVKNLKSQQRPDKGLFKQRFKHYDRLLLRILHEENNLGNEIFKEMYERNSIAQIFKFLDEKTTFIEELRIINKFNKAPFLRSLRKEIQ